MKKKYIYLGFSLIVFSACSASKQVETTESQIASKQTEVSSSEIKEKNTPVKEKNFEGTMGKHHFEFSFLDNEKYVEKLVTAGIKSNFVNYTEGTYEMNQDEIELKPLKNVYYEVFLDNPFKFIQSDEKEKNSFEKLFYEKDGSITITYILGKDKIQDAPDDAVNKLVETSKKAETYNDIKESMVQGNPTDVLFTDESSFSNWVLAHMASLDLKVRNLDSGGTLDNGAKMRYTLNVHYEGFEQAPGTTIGIDENNDMYEDTPRDGQPRNLSISTKWNEMLRKDLEAGKIVKSPDRIALEKLADLKGVWGIPHSDLGFEIMSNGNFANLEFGKSEPRISMVNLKNYDESSNSFLLEIEGKEETLTIIDEDHFKLGDSVYEKQKNVSTLFRK